LYNFFQSVTHCAINGELWYKPAVYGELGMAIRGQDWKPKTVRRFIKNFPTATEVVLVETDQGTGYLKALGNRSGPHALSCEWIGTNLATLLGLQTLEYSIIEIASNDEIPLASGMLALPGPAFITRAEKGISWGGKEGELDKLANPKDIGRLVLFDTWVVNCDRYPPDLTARKPNRDNVFLSRMGAPRGRLLIKAIDHTHCITCGREISVHLADIESVRDERIYGLFPEFGRFLERREVMRAVSDLRTITRSDIQAIVDTIPSEWQVNAPSRNALVNFLADRARFLCQEFVSLLWPQGEFDI
jgi:hypothetical protein